MLTGITDLKGITAIGGYNDANVDYMMGINLDEIFSERFDEKAKEDDKKAKEDDKNANKTDGYIIEAYDRYNNIKPFTYNRGIYFNITDRKGKAIAEAATKTMKEVNGTGTDIRDYNVFWYNCNVNAKYWLSMGGINIDPENKWFPNKSYTCTEDLILKEGKYNKWKPESGDLYDVWMKVGKNISVSKKQERCPLSE